MKYLSTFNQLFEKSLIRATQELKAFRKKYDATIDFDYVLSSVEGIRVSLTDLFPSLTSMKSIEKAVSTRAFLYELKTKSMRVGEVIDTRDSATLLTLPVKFAMIYDIGALDLETPNYLLVQRAINKKSFSENIELYYIQDDITKFFNSLSNLVMTIEHPVTKVSYIYKSSNSGEDWNLYRDDTSLSELKKLLDWNDIEEIKKLNYTITIHLEEK